MTSIAVKVAPVGRVSVGVRSGTAGKDGINGTGAVNSVNGEAGDVVLDAAKVHARPDTYVPAWDEVMSKPAVIAAGADAATARGVIGAGTSSFSGAYTDLSGKPSTFPPTIGATASTAMAGNKTAGQIGGATKTLGGAEAVAALATSGTVTMDCAAASVFTIAPAGAFTLAFSNVPASGTACTLTLVVTMGATAYAMTTPASVKWLSSTPALAANKRAVVTLMTVDGGTTWLASGADEK